MTPAYFRELYDYNFWNDRRIWRCVTALSDEQITQPIAYSQGAVLAQCFHVMAVEWWWIHFLHEATLDFLNPEAYPAPANVCQKWDETETYARLPGGAGGGGFAARGKARLLGRGRSADDGLSSADAGGLPQRRPPLPNSGAGGRAWRQDGGPGFSGLFRGTGIGTDTPGPCVSGLICFPGNRLHLHTGNPARRTPHLHENYHELQPPQLQPRRLGQSR